MFLPTLVGLILSLKTDYTDLIVTQDTTLTASDVLHRRVVVKADHVTLDGSGLTLSGPGKGGLKELETAGNGITVEGCTNVTIKNLNARGFAIGLKMSHCRAVVVENCDFSDNYSNPDHGWGDLPARGGIILEDVTLGVFRKLRANRVWDALSLTRCHDNLFEDNDFSRTSNTCAKLWESCRNKFFRNNLSYGIRIDRDKSEVHARDSSSVLIESGSDDNYFYRNDITHGGDGVFIRVLNGWVSRGNTFVENDTSFANNNCVESWSPNNTYIRNVAERGSYGFWLGGSDHTILIGNRINFNGLSSGYHNAPEREIGNGGLVIANFGSSNNLITGNEVIGNAGAGIAFRGDVASKGGAFRMRDWLIRQNRIEGNQIGIYGRYGDWIHIEGNLFKSNAKDMDVSETTRLSVAKTPSGPGRAPRAELIAPRRAEVGESVTFDASLSHEWEGKPLTCTWSYGDETANGAVVSKVFDHPGLFHVGLNVSNGALSDQASRDLIVTEKLSHKLGESVSDWGGEQVGSTASEGDWVFAADPDALFGRTCLRATQRTYSGELAGVVFPRGRNAQWDLSAKKVFVVWMKVQNPNNQGFQGPGPIVQFRSSSGTLTLKPAKDRNLFEWFNPNSEARYQWLRIAILLAGDEVWSRKVAGSFDSRKVNAVSVSLDSYGYDPFTMWLDGMHFE